MDFQRIKQSLRLRSGRGKKSQKQATPAQDWQERRPVTAPAQPERTLGPKKSSPTLPLWDYSTALPPIDFDMNFPIEKDVEEGALFRYNATSPLPNLPNAATRRTYSSAQSKPPTSRPSQMNREPFVPDEAPAVRVETPQMDVTQPERPQLEHRRTGPRPRSYTSDDFDLRPPPISRHKPVGIDSLSENLFSSGHLNTILFDPDLFGRFTAFLNRYRPHAAPILVRYLETQKAIKAVEYANAVAESMVHLPNDTSTPPTFSAAKLDSAFESRSKKAYETLLWAALPAYITISLVRVVTECMVNEITGRTTPIMNGLVSICLAALSEQKH